MRACRRTRIEQGCTNLDFHDSFNDHGFEGPQGARISAESKTGQGHIRSISQTDHINHDIHRLPRATFRIQLLSLARVTSSVSAHCSMHDSISYDGSLGYCQGHAQFSAPSTLHPGHRYGWFFCHHDGLREYSEFHRPGSATCRHDGADGLYGELDPTDGGAHQSLMLSPGWRNPMMTDCGRPMPTSPNTRWTCSTTHLVHQRSGQRRSIPSARRSLLRRCRASRTFDGTLFNLPSQTVFGLQTRYDDINLGLSNTVERQFLSNTPSTM